MKQIIKIKVIPYSKTGEIIKAKGELIVRVKEPPKKGRANKAVIKLLSKHFKAHASSVKIVSGLKSRKKVIEIVTEDKN